MLKDVNKFTKSYTDGIVNMFYGLKIEKLKMNRKKFHDEILGANQYGIMNTAYELLNAHRHNPYQSVDELLGDIQILLKDSLDGCKKTFGINMETYDFKEMIEFMEGKKSDSTQKN